MASLDLAVRLNEQQNAERRLSLLLFSEIKPYCIELSEISLLPSSIFKADNPKLISAISKVKSVLETHCELNSRNGPYRLSSNMADYIFFPISNLLQKPSLSDAVTSHILYIIGFLTENCWSYDPKVILIDQLFPIAIYLCGGNNNNKSSGINNKDFTFKQSTVYCLSRIWKSLPSDYFKKADAKRLSLLADSTTILLDVISSFNHQTLSQDQTKTIVTALDALENTYSANVSPEQSSYVFPGITSKIINFATTVKSPHFSIIVSVLKILKELIVKVFSDTSLDVQFQEPENLKAQLKDFNKIWEDNGNQDTLSLEKQPQIKISIKDSKNHHRTDSWLRATSTQLKISLTILFKSLLLLSTNKSKIKNRPQLLEEFVLFNKVIIHHCFYALFDLIPLTLDVLSLAIVASLADDSSNDIQHSNEEEYVELFTRVYTNSNFVDDEKLGLLYSQIEFKIKDLVSEKLSLVLFSTDDEKIAAYISSMKLHFALIHSISKTLKRFQSQLENLILNFITTLKEELINNYIWNNKKRKRANKNELLALLTGSQTSDDSNNKLDDIELPPHINAKQLTKLNKKSTNNAPENRQNYSMNLALLAHKWELGENLHKEVAIQSNYLKDLYSTKIESMIIELIKFLAELTIQEGNYHQMVTILLDNKGEDLDISDPINTLNRAMSLWMANNVLKSSKIKNHMLEFQTDSTFDINEFIDFHDETSKDTQASDNEIIADPSELLYLVMAKSQELIDAASESGVLDNEEIDLSAQVNANKVYEFSYAAAIDSIGSLSRHMDFQLFQTDYLIDYLFPLVEALTFNSHPLVQQHATNALKSISNNYYEGSLKAMIMDNLDYLIDSISLKLSVASSLTPTLPAILFVILKISGIDLLLNNQLQDLISHMFILIDSYHGYSILVEGFFIVFGEITRQVHDYYLKDHHALRGQEPKSKYHPWGLLNLEQVLNMIDDSGKLIQTLDDEYDSSKEYFKRKKPGVPFSQESDSDDDSDDNSDTESGTKGDDEDEESQWTSPIPKGIYLSIQQIFNYGFRLLSHPSMSLKLQILKTLKSVYPILSTNYLLLMPLIAQNWPILLTLISGSFNLSPIDSSNRVDHIQTQNLIIPSLELVIEIIEEDGKQEQPFLGSKFLEAWNFLSRQSRVLPLLTGKPRLSLKELDESGLTSYNPKMLQLYVRFLIKGLKNYERRIPDLVSYDIVRVCFNIGIPKDEETTKDIQNNIYVVKKQKQNCSNKDSLLIK